MQHIYWPYDEVTFGVDRDSKKVQVKAPWLQLNAKLLAGDDENYTRLGTKFAEQSITSEDVPWVQSLIHRFEKFPIFYILPMEKPSASDTHSPEGVLEKAPSVKQLLEHALRNETRTTDVAEILKHLSRQEFEWDAGSALQFSAVNDRIHPESLFSVARRYHLLDVLENDKGKEIFAHIEDQDPNARAKTVAGLVRQNHFVTQRCRESLLPAIDKAQSSRKEVEDFIRAENGHDRLLGLALREFTENPEEIPVADSTICLMNLLRLAAETNFLAFAMAVDFFERSSYEENDPLATLLTKAGFDQAARQINRHKEINDVGEHENVACHFLEKMQPCTAEYAVEALRLAETISLVMNSITKAALAIQKS